MLYCKCFLFLTYFWFIISLLFVVLELFSTCIFYTLFIDSWLHRLFYTFYKWLTKTSDMYIFRVCLFTTFVTILWSKRADTSESWCNPYNTFTLSSVKSPCFPAPSENSPSFITVLVSLSLSSALFRIISSMVFLPIKRIIFTGLEIQRTQLSWKYKGNNWAGNTKDTFELEIQRTHLSCKYKGHNWAGNAKDTIEL